MGKETRKIDDVIRAIAKSYGWTDKWYEHKVKEAYRACVGEQVAGVTESANVKDRILHLRYSNAAARNNMLYGLSDLKEKINKMLGEQYLKDIYLY